MDSLLQGTTCHVAYAPSFAWWFPAIGVLVFVVAAALALALRGWKRLFVAVLAAFALLWVIRAGLQVLGDYFAARRDAASAVTPVVEGLVEDFHGTAPDGSGSESFAVRGVPFSYSHYIITGGFRQTADQGGPVRQGLYVRIHYRPNSSSYVGNLIVKLEICP